MRAGWFFSNPELRTPNSELTYMYPTRRKNPAKRANIHFSGRAALLSQVLKVV